MKAVPRSCKTDAVSGPGMALCCFLRYCWPSAGLPLLYSALHAAPPRRSSASAIPNCSVLAERCFDPFLLAVLLRPANWYLPTFNTHLSFPLASNLQQRNYGSAGVNGKNHRLPKSPGFIGTVIRTNSQRADRPGDGQSAFMLKCLFVHSPLVLYDSILKALIHFSVYYCVRFF